MKSKPTPHIFIKGLLVAAAVFSIAGTGVFASSALLGQQYPFLAFGQAELGITDTQTDTATPTTTTTDNATEGTTTTAGDTTTTDATTTGGGTNQLAGIITGLALATDSIAPEWVTAGYWEIDSDVPLFGGTNETQPTVSDFNAIVEMARYDDGTALHTHRLTDFQQSDIVFLEGNTTMITGTLTVTGVEDGPVENVPVFITLQNNLISIAMDSEATHDHFGPTPITGLILAPEHLQEISNLLAPITAEAGTGAGTETTPGQQPEDTAAMTTETIGNTTGQ